MISRRRFLEIGSATAGVATASIQLFAEQGKASSLPPTIAQLKSRKSEASPITIEERGQRLDRARQLMAENALDAIVLMAGTTLRYFTGIQWWGGERMFALVLPANGTAFYVCPAFEEGEPASNFAMRRITRAATTLKMDLRFSARGLLLLDLHETLSAACLATPR